MVIGKTKEKSLERAIFLFLFAYVKIFQYLCTRKGFG